MRKLLICKDTLTGKLVSCQMLSESDSIKYELIEDAPVIEERENEIGHYEWDGETQSIKVVYEPRPKTQLDLIQEQLDVLMKQNSSIMKDGLVSMDLLITTDEKVTNIQDTIQAPQGVN